MRYYTVLDRQDGITYNCATVIGDIGRTVVHDLGPYTEEELIVLHGEADLKKYPALRDARKKRHEYIPPTYEEVLKKNMLVRNEAGQIIRIINRGCFDIVSLFNA